jgi:glycosyltransferase involved in cell wall biosynthesis
MNRASSPLISIITPVYNGIQFIESCINNVIDQECPAVEHVIVDGGSTDGTVDVIRRYAEKFPHIRWVSEKDRGQSDAMNKGVGMATGEIISFLNVDDYYEPGALREALALFDGLPEPSLLVGNCNVWGNDGKLWFVSRPKMISLRNLLLGRYMEAFPMNPSAYFYHKSLHKRIGGYDVEEHYGMDLDFIFKAVQRAHVTYLPRLWGNHRYYEGTKTYEDDKSGGNTLRVARITEHYLRQQPLHYRIYIVAVKKFGKIINRIRFGRIRNLLSRVRIF